MVLFTDWNDRFLYPLQMKFHTLSYTYSLKKVPLSGGASPFRPLYKVPPPPGNVDSYACAYAWVATENQLLTGTG